MGPEEFIAQLRKYLPGLLITVASLVVVSATVDQSAVNSIVVQISDSIQAYDEEWELVGVRAVGSTVEDDGFVRLVLRDTDATEILPFAEDAITNNTSTTYSYYPAAASGTLNNLVLESLPAGLTFDKNGKFSLELVSSVAITWTSFVLIFKRKRRAPPEMYV
jgi:hypothetical protein